ncbi:lysophospholipid acyltransferase family protein [Thermomonas brevis]
MGDSLRVRAFRALAGWVAGMAPARRLALARGLAPVAALLAGKRRRVARTNLRLCFPDMPARDREALLRRMLAANVKGLLDACAAWYADDLHLAGLYDVEGLQHLRDAVAQGRGVVILGAHFHGSELHMRAIRELAGIPVQPIVRAFRDAGIDGEINARRRQRLGGIIARSDLHAFCAAVRRGEAVVYTPDVNVRTRNVFAPFFGVPASTLDSMPVLLRRAGGVIVPAWTRPLPGGRYALVFEPPLPDFPGRDGAAAAARYNAWVEARVRQAPEGYDWGVKRFKTRPAGEADRYARRL